jgi:hypothetical protein
LFNIIKQRENEMKIITASILLSGSVLLLGCDNSNDPVPGHVKVFVTSPSYDGHFVGAGGVFPSGLAGADAACNTAAANGGQTGTWTAWLSDTTADAADRINNGGGAPYQLINGTVIASNLADLTDGTLAAAILIDESGNTIPGSFEVWTATATDGTYSGAGSCLDWTTDDAAEDSQSGRADAMDATWTNVGVEDCTVFNKLYCFADVNN